jgi:hypothetical protein
MHRTLVSLICALGLAVSFGVGAQPSTSSERELLNSERIEQVFGSYGIEVLSSTPALRVSMLYSTHGEQEICRTFAVVAYPSAIDAAIAAEHSVILDGGSIGATFAAAGWRVSKVHRYFGELPSTAKVEALMGGIEPTRLAVHVYALGVSRGGVEIDYASIVEVHHPDYLDLTNLVEIYGPASGPADDSAAALLALTARQMHQAPGSATAR